MRRFIFAIAIIHFLALTVSAARDRKESADIVENPEILIPSSQTWDLRSAAHFTRRAGFGASPGGLERYIELGFEGTLDEYLNPHLVDNQESEALLAARAYPLTYINNNGLERARKIQMIRWWMQQMLTSEHQLVEKMAFFFHDHFATSISKIRQTTPDHVPLLIVQNELFRDFALGNFKELVHLMARDPAMLLWLDNNLNVKGKPNENWARELLELFTLGIGNYSEKDIQEAARAFTGWGLNRSRMQFVFRSGRHDWGIKTFLGQSGNFNGDDVIDIIFQQQQTSRYLAKKLFEFFAYPDPSTEVVSELASIFRDSGYELKPLVRAILSHPEFFSERAYRAQIKSPVELAVQTYRLLGITNPVSLPRHTREMGQELFVPPDVGGWTSGIGWLNTTTLLTRYNFFNYVATRRGGGEFLDVQGMLEVNDLKNNYDATVYLLRHLVQNDVPSETNYILEEYLTSGSEMRMVESDLSSYLQVDQKIRGLIYLVMVLPVYQLN